MLIICCKCYKTNRPNKQNKNLGQNQIPLFNQNAKNNNFDLSQNPSQNDQNPQNHHDPQ